MPFNIFKLKIQGDTSITGEKQRKNTHQVMNKQKKENEIITLNNDIDVANVEEFTTVP